MSTKTNQEAELKRLAWKRRRRDAFFKHKTRSMARISTGHAQDSPVTSAVLNLNMTIKEAHSPQTPQMGAGERKTSVIEEKKSSMPGSIV